MVDDLHVLVNSSSDAGTDEGLDKHAAAALMYHGVVDSHDLVNSSSDAGTHEGLDKYAAAALMYHVVDNLHDLVNSSSDLGTDEGLNRHVLAGSLFSGTGEQASGRVDVPGKDKQQQAAAAKYFICFFVRSLGGASYVVKMEYQATIARVKQHVALKSGVCEDAFYLVWEGRVLRDGDTLGCLGVVRDTQLHMCSYLRGGVGMGRQPPDS